VFEKGGMRCAGIVVNALYKIQVALTAASTGMLAVAHDAVSTYFNTHLVHIKQHLAPSS
jgi:hypothetical protein